MYVQFKSGFVEADRWDGTKIPEPKMQLCVEAISRMGDHVIVCRSRVRSTLLATRQIAGCPSRVVFQSPKSWDYEFRLFLTAPEWSQALAAIAMDLDYRNFKSWCQREEPEQFALASAIWHAAKEES